jgi:hypothetical protein
VVSFLMWAIDPHDGAAWLGGIVVDATHQGKGYGRAAVSAALAEIEAPKFRTLLRAGQHHLPRALRKPGLHRDRRQRRRRARRAPRCLVSRASRAGTACRAGTWPPYSSMTSTKNMRSPATSGSGRAAGLAVHRDRRRPQRTPAARIPAGTYHLKGLLRSGSPGNSRLAQVHSTSCS